MRIICGKINRENVVNYWLCDLKTLNINDIGNYAIVENRNDYDLVKIVGILETNEKYLKFVTDVNPYKKVVQIVERNTIRED